MLRYPPRPGCYLCNYDILLLTSDDGGGASSVSLA